VIKTAPDNHTRSSTVVLDVLATLSSALHFRCPVARRSKSSSAGMTQKTADSGLVVGESCACALRKGSQAPESRRSPPPSRPSRRVARTRSARRALADLAIACEVADELRRCWEDDGRPLTAPGSRDQPVEHPLIESLREQQRHVSALGAWLGLDSKALREMGGSGWRRGAPRAPDHAASLRPSKVVPIAEGLREREP
jgi:hypothetical protein